MRSELLHLSSLSRPSSVLGHQNAEGPMFGIPELDIINYLSFSNEQDM